MKLYYCPECRNYWQDENMACCGTKVVRAKTRMKDWTLSYRKLSEGSISECNASGWYWRLETDWDIWDYGEYGDRECAISDWKDMVEHRGFEVEE